MLLELIADIWLEILIPILVCLMCIVVFIIIVRKNKEKYGTVTPLSPKYQGLIVLLVIVIAIGVAVVFEVVISAYSFYEIDPSIYSKDWRNCYSILKTNYIEKYGPNIGSFDTRIAQATAYQSCIEHMAIKNQNKSICMILPEINSSGTPDDHLGRAACELQYK